MGTSKASEPLWCCLCGTRHPFGSPCDQERFGVSRTPHPKIVVTPRRALLICGDRPAGRLRLLG